MAFMANNQDLRGDPRLLELQENSVAAGVRSSGPTSPLPLRRRNGAFPVTSTFIKSQTQGLMVEGKFFGEYQEVKLPSKG